MKITLMDVYSKRKEYINKDVMAGFGEVTRIGGSIGARLIESIKKRGINLPVFSLAYVAAILSKDNHEVDYSTDKVPDSDLVIIQSSIVDYKEEIEMAQKIKEKTGAKVGFIGPFASIRPEIFIKHADFVIQGEPERAISMIREDALSGIIRSGPVDPDSLPYPKWDIFPVDEYSYKPVIRSRPFLPILSSRGCSYLCNYCPYRSFYGRLRQRGIKSIVREVGHLIREFGIQGLLFRNPLVTFDKKRSIDIADGIKRHDIEWACETHPAMLDNELLDKLYSSGLRSVNIGIESSDEQVLKRATRKFSDKRHQEKVIDHCEKIGIKVSAFYILGLPDDTKETIRDTIKYAKRLNTHAAQFFISTPFPGTEFYEQVKDKIYADWESFDSFTPTFKHKNLSADELLKLKESAYLQYYFRLRYLTKNILS